MLQRPIPRCHHPNSLTIKCEHDHEHQQEILHCNHLPKCTCSSCSFDPIRSKDAQCTTRYPSEYEDHDQCFASKRKIRIDSICHQNIGSCRQTKALHTITNSCSTPGKLFGNTKSEDEDTHYFCVSGHRIGQTQSLTWSNNSRQDNCWKTKLRFSTTVVSLCHLIRHYVDKSASQECGKQRSNQPGEGK